MKFLCQPARSGRTTDFVIRRNSMKFLCQPARSGRTTELIRMSAEKREYILVASKSRADYLFSQAKGLGLNIPFPISVGECLHGVRDIQKKPILIDDLEDVLQSLLNVPIDTVVIDSENII